MELNGPAARMASIGDKVIVLAYGHFEEEEAKVLQPTILLVGENNAPVE